MTISSKLPGSCASCFSYFLEDEQALLANGGRRFPGDSMEVSVTDFIAGMTDRFAINLYHKLFLPTALENLLRFITP